MTTRVVAFRQWQLKADRPPRSSRRFTAAIPRRSGSRPANQLELSVDALLFRAAFENAPGGGVRRGRSRFWGRPSTGPREVLRVSA